MAFAIYGSVISVISPISVIAFSIYNEPEMHIPNYLNVRYQVYLFLENFLNSSIFVVSFSEPIYAYTGQSNISLIKSKFSYFVSIA